MARKARKFIHITGKSGFLFPLVPVAQADLDIAHNYRKIVQPYSVYNQQKKNQNKLRNKIKQISYPLYRE